VVKAFERAYAQIRVELKGLGHSFAVSYPLIEFFATRLKAGDKKLTPSVGETTADGSKKVTFEQRFVTTVLWTEDERREQVERIASAALGPLATLLAPTESAPR